MLNLIKNSLSAGETIFDHESKSPIRVTNRNMRNILFGVVSISKDSNDFIYGYFIKNPMKNIIISINESVSAIGLNRDVFGKNIVYSNSIGMYIMQSKDDKGGDRILMKGSGGFPYNIERLYESHDHLKEFAESPKLEAIFDNKYKELLKYTFGLEYETTSGYIPQELCYRYGLVPVRDGSISGVEYASIVLDKTDGLERVKKHLELLKKYTSFNKECSYHIHFGGYPVDSRSIFSLYNLWMILAEELSSYLPKFAFNTGAFKASRKDYCKKNPQIFSNFGELYHFLSGGNASFAGSLTQNHPQDPEKRAKWQIRERYWAQSLIGMCFYDGPKTVEYRMLFPSYNEHKVIFWIYLFNAIMLYAEELTKRYGGSKSLLLQIYRSRPNIRGVLKTVYPENLAENMIDMLEKLKYIVDNQLMAGDPIGENTAFEDSVIKTGIFK